MATPVSSVRLDIKVNDLAQLSNVLVSNVVDGANAFVVSEGDYWIFLRNNGSPLGPDVVSSRFGSASDRWVRLSSSSAGWKLELTGDVSGGPDNSPLATTVVGLRGVPIEDGTPSNGDALVFNSSTGNWEYAVVGGGGGGTPSGPASGDLGGLFPSPVVVGLHGNPIASTPPSVGDTLTWDGSSWTPQSGSSSQSIEWQATCEVSVSVGDLVFAVQSVSGNLSVEKIDIYSVSKMPALGIVFSKSSDTSCTVVSSGLVPATGLIPGASYFASSDGRIALIPPTPDFGPVFQQIVGIALTANILLVQLPSSIIERVP